MSLHNMSPYSLGLASPELFKPKGRIPMMHAEHALTDGRERKLYVFDREMMLLGKVGGVAIEEVDDATAVHYFLEWLREKRATRLPPNKIPAMRCSQPKGIGPVRINGLTSPQNQPAIKPVKSPAILSLITPDTKEYTCVANKFAACGHDLSRIEYEHRNLYCVSRNGQAHVMSTWQDVRSLLAQIGGATC